MHKARLETGWHMATLFKCFSMCLWCQHLFHTYLHLKGGKKDVSVTFSKCQVWRGEERERRGRDEGDLRDLSMHALHNLFIYPGEID